jgi:hypothetical protein
VFNQFGDLERVMLRRGNHHSAKFWRRVLLPVIARYRGLKNPKLFRGDAAFATPKLMKPLEAEGYRYTIRLKANAVLERHIAHLLKRPVGRPSKKPKVFYHGFRYRAKSWDCVRRVVAKVEWHAGELFPRLGFVVTNLKRDPKRVIKFYNGHGGTVDQRGEERPEVDAAVVPAVPGQPGAAPVVRHSLQPGQFPAATGAAPSGADLDADDAAVEADQDRGQGRPPRQGHHVPAGGGGGVPGVVRSDPGADRSAASSIEPRVIVRRGWMRVASSRGGRGRSAVR